MGRLEKTRKIDESQNTISYTPNQHPLYDSVRECRKCSRGCNLKYGKIFPWAGSGKILFVAIQPSWTGHPENPEGRMTLESVLKFNRLRKCYGLDKYPLTNLVKCATTKANTYPTKEQIYNCLPWLAEEIRAFKTKLVVFVGKDNYERYGKDIETIFGVKTTWCYHYSSSLANRKGIKYLSDQRRRMKVIVDTLLAI